MKNTRSLPGEKPTSDEVDASIAALESLLDRAFYSEDELRTMSHDQQIAASDARLYVIGLFDKVNRLDLEGNCNTNDKSANDETEDDEFYAIVPSPRPSIDRPRQIAWACAARYLDEIARANQHKAVWDFDNQRKQVVEELAQSLRASTPNRDTAHDFLGALEALSQNHTFRDTSGRILSANFGYLDQLLDEKGKEKYWQIVMQPEVFKTVGNVFENANWTRDWRSEENGFIFLHNFLARLGIKEVDEVVRTVNEDSTDLMLCLSGLEQERPGAIQVLHSFYGIRNFGRWGKEFLTEQYDCHGDTTKPYGLLITALDDRGDDGKEAFRKDGGRGKTHSLDKHFVRAIEVASAPELVQRLNLLKDMYGHEHQIDFCVLTGHGASESICLSAIGDKLGSLAVGQDFSRLYRWFSPDATIVLQSCSTGAQGGLAQTISRQSGLRVIAPPVSAGCTMYYRYEGDRVIAEPDYRIAVNETNELGSFDYVQPAMYIAGELVDPTSGEYTSYFKGLAEHRAESPDRKGNVW
jgi:hypothetical protein